MGWLVLQTMVVSCDKPYEIWRGWNWEERERERQKSEKEDRPSYNVILNKGMGSLKVFFVSVQILKVFWLWHVQFKCPLVSIIIQNLKWTQFLTYPRRFSACLCPKCLGHIHCNPRRVSVLRRASYACTFFSSKHGWWVSTAMVSDAFG